LEAGVDPANRFQVACTYKAESHLTRTIRRIYKPSQVRIDRQSRLDPASAGGISMKRLDLH
jgi:hypothetical protein